jgi:hypothetical protein
MPTALFTLIAAVAALAHQAAPPAAIAAPAVRSSDADLRRLLASGCTRSPTFRALGDRIAAAQGIVQVEPGSCRSGRGCLVHWMAVGEGVRVVRVLIERPAADHQAISTIGHELRHAVEVLDDQTIRTGRAMYWHFRPAFATARRTFETREALETESHIRLELDGRLRPGPEAGCGAFAGAIRDAPLTTPNTQGAQP